MFKKRDVLLEGIAAVASVEDDIKAAFMIARTSRASLKQAGDEVMRNLRVVGQTQRKQNYLELLTVCLKVKRVHDLQKTLKRAQESGDYGEAILVCVECFQEVERMKGLEVRGAGEHGTAWHGTCMHTCTRAELWRTCCCCWLRSSPC